MLYLTTNRLCVKQLEDSIEIHETNVSYEAQWVTLGQSKGRVAIRVKGWQVSGLKAKNTLYDHLADHRNSTTIEVVALSVSLVSSFATVSHKPDVKKRVEPHRLPCAT